MSLLPVHDRDGPGAGPWIVELWVEEREHLMPVPAPFDGFVEHTKSVSSACLITHDHDRYSVPSSFANQPVSVRVYATQLAVVADARIVTEHERVFTRDYTAIGMARAFAELAEQSSPAYRQAEGILEVLLKAELAEREVRSVNYQMKSAKFPVYRDLAGFDFTQAQVNEALMRELHRCTFLDDAQNIVLVGGPGSGKTRLATALGHPGLAPVAAPICAAISEENTMTIKSSRKKLGSRAAKATNRKNSKATAAKPPGTTKLALLVAHLSAPGGATIAELCKATGWQPHSVRGGLAGALRRKGHVIRSEKEGGLRRYRIEEPVV